MRIGIRGALLAVGVLVALVSEGLAATGSTARLASESGTDHAPTWLTYVNSIRVEAGLPSLTEEPSWSEGIRKHAIYMVKTGKYTHFEDPDSPWYTPEGDAAARNSNLGFGENDEDAINGWLRGAFHALGILRPGLTRTGFATYGEPGDPWMAAGFDVGRGRGEVPPEVEFPIEWPPDGSTTRLLVAHCCEWPDPLTSCSGYEQPVGLPISLQLGPGWTFAGPVDDHSFLEGTTPRPHCVIDGSSYRNPNPADQDLARGGLRGSDAIVLIPQRPLKPGHTYTVSITAAGTQTTWSFTAAASAPSPTIADEHEGKKRCKKLTGKRRRRCRKRDQESGF